MAELSTDIRETVRECYAKAAQASAAGRYDEAAGIGVGLLRFRCVVQPCR